MLAPTLARHVLHRGDAAWPRALDALARPPDRLRLVGDGAILDPARTVALVGTRRPDAEAADFAWGLAQELAVAGVVVISGGARGIDAAAHEGALAAGGATVAVLASGLARAYPAAHRALFERIAAAGGALVSEAPDDAVPQPGRFLARNRLVAALACAVVVVQAPARSGALNTARWARQLGKPVFSVPHAPWEVRGEGCLSLLAGGARVCTRARDVLSVAASKSRGTAPGTPGKTENQNNYCDLDADGRGVLEAIGTRTRHVDEIVRRAALPPARVQRALLSLLLLGLIEERGVSRYGPWGRRTRAL